VPLLGDETVFVDSQEERGDIVVAKPYPGIAEDEGRDEVYGLCVIINIL